MEKKTFKASTEPTLGVELELAIVDADTMALTSAAPRMISEVPAELSGSVKPELMQCYLELNTRVCRTIQEAEADLLAKLQAVQEISDRQGLRLYWTGTHPFSLWEQQTPTDSERYSSLLKTLQDVGRQLVTFGLHVHVGVDSGDKAVMICERMMRHLPVLLALSCNSPWWNNRVTGLLSHRSKIMEGLPTAGLPPMMRNWSEYVWLVKHLEETGFIHSIRDIWWIVRPHHNFGTVEVRVCDMPGSLDDALALTALIHCLVSALSDEIDQGTYQHDCHPMLVRQNIWRAERFGLDAQLVDVRTHESRPAREMAHSLIARLQRAAVKLGCEQALERVAHMAAGPTWAERQLKMLEETGDPAEVVRRMSGASRVRGAV